MSRESEIRNLSGPLSDEAVAAILETGARRAELEAAALRLAAEDEALDERPPVLSRSGARVLEIVSRDESYADAAEDG